MIFFCTIDALDADDTVDAVGIGGAIGTCCAVDALDPLETDDIVDAVGIVDVVCVDTCFSCCIFDIDCDTSNAFFRLACCACIVTFLFVFSFFLSC